MLTVDKTAPRVARVGDRIRFTLKVTNTGSVTATNVRLADIPPASVTLAGLESRSTAQVIRGNAVWRLGNLAPGATRTVSGSVRIQAGTPGLKRNLAVAGAVNTQLADDIADTRVLPRRQPPPVTG